VPNREKALCEVQEGITATPRNFDEGSSVTGWGARHLRLRKSLSRQDVIATAILAGAGTRMPDSRVRAGQGPFVMGDGAAQHQYSVNDWPSRVNSNEAGELPNRSATP